MLQKSLRHRLMWLLLQFVTLALVAIAILGIFGQRAIRRESDHQREETARLMAAAVDRQLSAATQEAAWLVHEISASGRPASPRLRQHRFQSIFRRSLSLVTASGTVIVSDPPGARLPAHSVWRGVEGVTGVYEGEDGRPTVALILPLRLGSGLRFLIAEMDLARSALSRSLMELAGEDVRHMALVDEQGRVLAANNEPATGKTLYRVDALRRALADQKPVKWSGDRSVLCPDSPKRVLSVIVPLRGARWGLILQEHRDTALAAAVRVQQGTLLVGLLLIGGGLLLVTALWSSIVTPLKALADQAARMTEGDLATPVEPEGDREIRLLGESLDSMRERLHESLARLEAFNASLEAEVASRTATLAERDAESRVLVRRLLSAGEEERCRIARELHDETAQMLTAVQLVLDERPEPDLDKARRLLQQTQHEIHRVIHDLRPSLLDDLGLRAAIRSHAEVYLRANGIAVSLEIDKLPPLDSSVEISIFRVYQELATNVLRHADAEHVSVELYAEGERLTLAVEDDGAGFDVATRRTGAGITGMRERIELIGGKMTVDSEPGMGTHVFVEVPIRT